jgi:hypothetical protein
LEWLLLLLLLLEYKAKLLHVCPFRRKFFGIIQEEGIILHNPLLDLIDDFGLLTLEHLNLIDTALFQGTNQLLAVPSYLSREVGPFDLGIEECLFRKLFLFLESN